MAFIAIDENIRASWYKHVASWGYDLLCARPGEGDWEFIQRCLNGGVSGFLSLDSDIPQLLYGKFNVDIPCAKTPWNLKELLIKAGKFGREERRK